MSNHREDTPDLKSALEKHGLPSDKPSQLADAFRLGWNTRTAPKVKELVWYRPFNRDKGEMLAKVYTSGLYYSITSFGSTGSKFKLTLRGSHAITGMGLYLTEEDAKAGAKAHYDRRILSALTETET